MRRSKLQIWILLILLLSMSMSCSKKLKINEVGVFLKIDKELTALSKGTASGVESRAIATEFNPRPEFIVNIPGVDVSAFMFGTEVENSKTDKSDRGYKLIQATLVALEGNPGVFIMTPKSDLAPGLNVIVTSQPLGMHVIFTDVDNCWSFINGSEPRDRE